MKKKEQIEETLEVLNESISEFIEESKAQEKRMNLVLNSKFDKLDQFEKALEIQLKDLKAIEAPISESSLKKFAEIFVAVIDRHSETLEESFRNFKKTMEGRIQKQTWFYRAFSFGFALILIVVGALVYSQNKYTTAKTDLSLLHKDMEFTQSYNTDLTEYLEDRKQTKLFKKWRESKYAKEDEQ